MRCLCSWVVQLPTASRNVDVDSEVDIRVGVHSAATADFSGDKDLVGQWELTDETDAQKASVKLMIAIPLVSGKTAFPTEWKSQLSSGAYTLTWSAPDNGSVAVYFTIIERD